MIKWVINYKIHVIKWSVFMMKLSYNCEILVMMHAIAHDRQSI